MIKACLCVTSLASQFLFAWHSLDRASLLYTTLQPTTLNVLRHYALHVRFVPTAPAPDSLLDGTTVPICSSFSLVHEPNTPAASLFPLGRTVDEKDRDGLKRNRGLRYGNMICRPTPELTTRPVHENCTLFHGGKGPYSTYDLLSDLLHLGIRIRFCSHLLNNPMLEQIFLAKYCVENARGADYDLRENFRTTANASVPPTAGFVSPLGSSSLSLQTVKRALEETGNSMICANIGSLRLGLGRRAQREMQNMIPLHRKDREVSPRVAVGKPARHSEEVGRWHWC